MADTTAYIPGVCNINRAEIAYRRKWAFIGLGLTVVIAAMLFALHVNRWVRVVLFLPAFIAAIGYLQTKNKFCVTYGAAGQQNAAEGSAKAQAVTDAVAAAKDKAKARTMNAQAAIAAVIVAAVAIAV